MSNFKALDRSSFKNYVALMQSVIAAGYDNDFDNSLVIRAITEKIDDIWSTAGQGTGYYITSECESDTKHGTTLKLIIHSGINDRVKAAIILFDDLGTLRVRNNVLLERAPKLAQHEYRDLNYIGVIDVVEMKGYVLSEESNSLLRVINQHFIDSPSSGVPRYNVVVRSADIAVTIVAGGSKVTTMTFAISKKLKK